MGGYWVHTTTTTTTTTKKKRKKKKKKTNMSLFWFGLVTYKHTNLSMILGFNLKMNLL